MAPQLHTNNRNPRDFKETWRVHRQGCSNTSEDEAGVRAHNVCAVAANPEPKGCITLCSLGIFISMLPSRMSRWPSLWVHF